MAASRGDNKRSDLTGRWFTGIRHRSVCIPEFPFDDALQRAFEPFVIEATLIVTNGDFSVQDLIDFENFP